MIFWSVDILQNESQIGQNDLLSKVIWFFISANIPFNVTDNPYFQELIQTAQSKNNVHMVNHKNIREQLREMAISAKEDLMTTVMQNHSNMSLALGCWMSKNNYICIFRCVAVAYKTPSRPETYVLYALKIFAVAITVYWINKDWNLHEA